MDNRINYLGNECMNGKVVLFYWMNLLWVSVNDSCVFGNNEFGF